jgi:hypothetical protein
MIMSKEKNGIQRDGTPGKYPYGCRVVVNGNIAGIVLHSYNMYMEGRKPMYFYRIIVDARDMAYRCVNNNIDQTGEPHLLSEDFSTLLTDTNNLMVIEVEENRLLRYIQ